VQRQDLSFEILDAIVSVETPGGGLRRRRPGRLSSSTPDLASVPGFVQWGLELRGPPGSLGLAQNTRLRPVRRELRPFTAFGVPNRA